jgi:hypothetical protein
VQIRSWYEVYVFFFLYIYIDIFHLSLFFLSGNPYKYCVVHL